METSRGNCLSKTEYRTSNCWYSDWYRLSWLTLLLRRRPGISRRLNHKTYTFVLDLYRKSRRQGRELCTDKLYPCLFRSWRGKIGGKWFNSALILGHRSCPQRRTCFGGWRQNYFGQHPKVLKVCGSEILSCHPMEKEHYLTSKQLWNGTSKTWRNRTQASEEPGDR